jgi:hypothetical protein
VTGRTDIWISARVMNCDGRRRNGRWPTGGGDGTLPSGEAIARAHGRQERWGRLVKSAGQAGAFGTDHTPLPRLAADKGGEGSAC